MRALKKLLPGSVKSQIKMASVFVRDTKAICRWGLQSAPKFAELIWVDPLRCTLELTTPFHRGNSARVLAGEWDLSTVPVIEDPKIQICARHWCDGLSWKDAGAYDYMLHLIEKKGEPVDGCANFSDVVNRYDRLDFIFETVRQEGRLRSQHELGMATFREFGGVMVHIGRTGEPIFGKAGHHRFAIAKILHLPIMPAQIGVVHRNALHCLKAYRIDGGAIRAKDKTDENS